LAGVAQEHAPTAPTQQQGRTEARRTTPGNDHVEHEALALQEAQPQVWWRTMDVAEFDFDLPDELIAQEPPPERGRSRLLVVDRESVRLEHAMFEDLGRFLRPGDVLVVNDTRVFPARLLGQRVPSGGAVECLLIRELAGPDVEAGSSRLGSGSAHVWEALMHPGQKLKPGARVRFEDRTPGLGPQAGPGVVIHGEVLERRFFGRRTIRLESEGADLDTAIGRIGHIPLPPYIRRDDRPSDRERYQTVYAHERGSIAAPTAGLHFTDPLLAKLTDLGIEQVRVTLHVGYGTFKPVRVERVEDHVVDPERFTVSEQAAEALTRGRGEGRRIIAVGTTTTRALESLEVTRDGQVLPQAGEATLFIHPGHEFRLVRGLITNFHLPRSSLLMLVAAFAGRDRVMNAYRAAVEARYRFYSYGDAMLIL
jgi:S-adenosylmethionine:tRNA ribosyltransferase-isomerase